MAPIQALGQSLDHWQALYILSIAVAVISTIAIVTFAFHIQQHKYGLKVSNYLYVLASVLAVVSTIVIVNKTKSLDLEKDRLANIEVSKAKKDAADALKGAAEATEKAGNAEKDAETARLNAETARQKAGSIQAKAEEARTNSLEAEKQANLAVLDKEKILGDNLKLQKQVEDERAARLQIESSLAPRNLDRQAQQTMIAELKQIPKGAVDFVTFGGNAEADNLMKQVGYSFQAANWAFGFATPMSGSATGITIKYDPHDEAASNAAIIVQRALAASGIITTVIPSLPPAGELGAYASGGTFGQAKIRIYIGSK